MTEAPVARVVVLSGPNAGTAIEFEEKLTIGRRPENALSLRDEQMSRFHALIERRGEQFVLEDLSRRHRTRVDGRVVEGSVYLEDHARITLGRTILRFRMGASLDNESADSITMPEIRTFTNAPFTTAPGTIPGKPTTETLPGPVDTSPAQAMRVVPVSQESLAGGLASGDFDDLKKASEHLRTLLAANTIISTELDLEKLFERILDALFDSYPAHRAVILTANGDELDVRATRVETRRSPRGEPQISSTIAYRSFREQVGVLTLDASLDERFDANRSIVDQDIRSAISSPMIHRDEVLGVVYLDTVGVAHAFSEDDLKLLNAIASAAGGAVKNALLVQRLKDTALDTIFRLAVAAEHRDEDTGYHIHRMSEYAATIARSLGLDSDYAETLRLAAPMHDVGKIGIPDSILKKPGKLTAEEYEIMKQHTVKGGEILANAHSELLQMAQNIALTHHEKFDGSGYPKGLEKERIPLEGRIVAVADVFDAIMSRRCYKPAFALDKSLRILEDGSGQHFDPEVIDAFMNAQDQILRIRDHYAKLESNASANGEPPGHHELFTRRDPVM